MTTETVAIEVAYALPERQWLISVALKQGARARDALMAAEGQEEFPALPAETTPLSIWGRPVPPDQVLRSGDRVEILRPLLIDPRTARRQLAAAGQVMGQRLPANPD